MGGLSAGVTVAARAARVCTVCMMAAYILAFIVETREYSYRTTPGRDRYTPFPGFAWITGTIAGALWVIAGSAGCCAPPQDVLICTALKARRVGRAVGRNIGVRERGPTDLATLFCMNTTCLQGHATGREARSAGLLTIYRFTK